MTKTTKKKKKQTYGCDDCYKKGYVLEKKGKYSNAKICQCLNCEECSGTGKNYITRIMDTVMSNPVIYVGYYIKT